jgi:hypothetical protein
MMRLKILVVALLTCMVLSSCDETCRPGVVQVTGRWSGVVEDYLDTSLSDARIVLTVTQHNSMVSGTLWVTISCNGGRCFATVDTLYSGSFHNGELMFTLRHENDDLEHEFTGHLERDRIDGIWRSKQLSTGEVRFSSTWYVEREVGYTGRHHASS